MTNDIQARLADTLKRQLPQASKKHLLSLAKILTVPGTPPDPQTFAGLLDEGCDPNSLHAAILYGRETAVESICSTGELAPELNTALSRFDRMVSIMMQHLLGQLKTRLSDRELEGLLSKATIHWMREGKIELYNYFMEIPVKAQVAVRDVHDHTLTVERSRDLVSAIAAGDHGRNVMTILPGSHLALMLEVVSAVRDKIHLRHARVFPQVRERRRYTRVQPEPLLPVNLDITGSGTFPAKAMDYSEKGMGLILHQRIPLHPGHVIGINWFTYGRELKSAATVRWLQQVQNTTRLGIELSPDTDTRRQLQQMVGRAQRHVLGRLKMKGVPDSLL